MMMRKLIPAFFIISLMLSGCRKEVPPDAPPLPPAGSGMGVLVVNEGNFQWGNASITLYDLESGTHRQDVFSEVNNRPLGDVGQSISLYNGLFYITVNNSNKTEVLYASDFSSAGVINGLTSPRYFMPAGISKAYITDLYSNGISVVDISSLSLTGRIPCRGSTEEMLADGGSIWVTNTRTSFIYRINTATDQITDSILVWTGGNSMVRDYNGRLWVMCSGDKAASVNGKLCCIDLVSGAVASSFDLGSPRDIWDKVKINRSLDTLYFMNDDIYRMPVNATALPPEPFIQRNGRNFHSIAVHPASGNIFVSDAADYIQNGTIYYYSPSGGLLGSFGAGIIPGEISFY